MASQTLQNSRLMLNFWLHFWLRLAMVAGVIVIGLVAESLTGAVVLGQTMVAVIVAVLVANLLLWLGQRSAAISDESRDAALLFRQLLIDSVLITAGLAASGGAGSPFVSLYLLPISIAAANLDRRRAWSVTSLSLLLYSLLMLWHFIAADGHAHHHGGATGFNWHVLGMWANAVLAAALLTWFLSRMRQLLQEREQGLEALKLQAVEDRYLLNLAAQAAGAAHELNTPLGTMQLLVDELGEQCDSDGGHGGKTESLQLMRQQLAACQEKLRQLVHTASDETTEPLREYVSEALDHWQLLRPEIRCDLSFTEPATAQLMVTPALRQALVSLFNNAADASVRNGHDEISIQASSEAGQLQIAIEDLGSGFDSSEAMSAAGDSHAGAGGLGIGLMLARSIISQHGGELSHAKTSTGTRCVVRLPVVDDQVADDQLTGHQVHADQTTGTAS